MLRVLAGAAGGLAIIQTAGLLGCADVAPEPEGLRIPLSQVPPGGRVSIRWMGQPVEIVRTASGVAARSLVCTHFACIVRWQEQQGVYLCPCHHGIYDADGKVIGGPPTKPLQQFKVAISGDTLIIGAPLPS